MILRWTTVLIVAALLAAGCAGGSDQPASTPTQSPPAEGSQTEPPAEVDQPGPTAEDFLPPTGTQSTDDPPPAAPLDSEEDGPFTVGEQ